MGETTNLESTRTTEEQRNAAAMRSVTALIGGDIETAKTEAWAALALDEELQAVEL